MMLKTPLESLLEDLYTRRDKIERLMYEYDFNNQPWYSYGGLRASLDEINGLIQNFHIATINYEE